MAKITFIFSLTVLLSLVKAFAQEPSRPGDPQFGGEGRLVILRVVPGDKTAKLYFIGKKAAEFDFNKDHKLLSVTALSNGKSETLQFRNKGDSYEVLNVPSEKGAYELNVKSEIKGKVEDIKVKVQTPKP
ncbi:MAG: hypothetical protein ACXVCP_05125 [Bdellovibrio sp.]